jgi:hypothetical protein
MPPTIFTLLPKFTVPHAAFFCFKRITYKHYSKNQLEFPKIKLEELVPSITIGSPAVAKKYLKY